MTRKTGQTAPAPMNPVPGKVDAVSACFITGRMANCPVVSSPRKLKEPMTGQSAGSFPFTEKDEYRKINF
jgi:hypothetical protein